MTQLQMVPPELRVLDDTPTDLLVLATFSDERPLEGLTGIVDWRLCGAVSSWKQSGFASGAYGEQILYPTVRLAQARVLLMGLGPRAEHRSDRAFAIAKQALATAAALGALSVTVGLFGLEALASPLERTGAKLVEILKGQKAIQRVALVVSEQEQKLVKDGIGFYGGR